MERSDAILCGLSAIASAGVLWALWRARIVGPGSFPRDPRGRRDVGAGGGPGAGGVPVPIWLVAAAMVFLAQAFVYGLLSQAPASVMGTGLFRQGAIAIVVYAAALGVGVLLIWLIGSQLSDRSGLRVRVGDLWRGVVGFLLAAPLCVLVSYASQGVAWLITQHKPEPVAHDVLKQIVDERGTPAAWLLIVGAVLLAPAVEEIMYRGFLQSCLLAALGRVWPAIIGTSAIFAAMHWVGGGPVPLHALPVLFTLSLAMGVAFERTRSLGVSIVMHALFNAANIVVAVLGPHS